VTRRMPIFELSSTDVFVSYLELRATAILDRRNAFAKKRLVFKVFTLLQFDIADESLLQGDMSRRFPSTFRYR
jgi:hypothetical protein